jgi:hypothetical protein
MKQQQRPKFFKTKVILGRLQNLMSNYKASSIFHIPLNIIPKNNLNIQIKRYTQNIGYDQYNLISLKRKLFISICLKSAERSIRSR